ncbi:MAG: hypothetical protein ABOJ95_000509 [Wolbachia endosymbiont of Armadillidium vulgare]|uniref:Transposase n=1 Tax=Wolbachia endosymbiont of Armadillidium arcangelii TaxID=3158571 RepID=A0AAU7Q110_9RICK
MNKITCLSKKLKEFFNEKADKISITTRFIIEILDLLKKQWNL